MDMSAGKQLVPEHSGLHKWEATLSSRDRRWESIKRHLWISGSWRLFDFVFCCFPFFLVIKRFLVKLMSRFLKEMYHYRKYQNTSNMTENSFNSDPPYNYESAVH